MHSESLPPPLNTEEGELSVRSGKAARFCPRLVSVCPLRVLSVSSSPCLLPCVLRVLPLSPVMLELYADLLSQPCRAVLLLLHCTRTPHQLRTVALRKGEQRSPEFTKLNPMQKVPVLVDDGFVLTESAAILQYLVSQFSLPDHWYPSDPQRRARVDEYTNFHQSYTRPHAAKVFILEVLIPAQTRSRVDGPALDRALSDLDQTLDKLETMFLRRQPFLCGTDISVADLLCVCELMQPVGGDRDVLESRPQLQRWRNRVQSAVGPAFDHAHSVLYALRDRYRARTKTRTQAKL